VSTGIALRECQETVRDFPGSATSARLAAVIPRPSPDSALFRRADLLRTGVATALFAAASLWPLLNLGSRRALVTIFGSHGIDRSDVLAVIPFAAAIVVLLTPWRRRTPFVTCLLIGAFGLGLGVALGFVARELRQA
jgi:hypothetical protein